MYQMNFPEASIRNYAMIKNVFPNSITTFSACFWAKILTTECGIFTYSTPITKRSFQGIFMTAVPGWNLLLTTFGVTLVQGVFYS